MQVSGVKAEHNQAAIGILCEPASQIHSWPSCGTWRSAGALRRLRTPQESWVWISRGTRSLVQRIRQIGTNRLLCGSDAATADNAPKDALKQWRSLPLTPEEFRVIENNVAPYLRDWLSRRNRNAKQSDQKLAAKPFCKPSKPTACVVGPLGTNASCRFVAKRDLFPSAGLKWEVLGSWPKLLGSAIVCGA